MGLDWNPGPKPRQGSESEFRELWAALQSRWCWDRSGKRKKFQELTITAFETLAAPRVGFDDAATRWAHQAFSDRADKAVSEDEFVRGLNGLYVLDLVPPCDGIPRYTNGDAGGYVERYSFRGQFLADCVGIIGQELFDQAYRSKMPENTGR